VNESTIRIHPQGRATAVAQTTLPPAFSRFEPLVEQWALGSEKARAEKRVATPIELLRSFQQAVLPDLERMIQYFNTLPNDPDALRPEDKRLYHLAQMVMEASAPLDLQWTTPDIEDVFPLERIKFLPPSI
jgi:hypothetical protein